MITEESVMQLLRMEIKQQWKTILKMTFDHMVICKISKKGVHLGWSYGSYMILSDFLVKIPIKIKYRSPKREFKQPH